MHTDIDDFSNQTKISIMQLNKILILLFFLGSISFFSSCDDDDDLDVDITTPNTVDSESNVDLPSFISYNTATTPLLPEGIEFDFDREVFIISSAAARRKKIRLAR